MVQDTDRKLELEFPGSDLGGADRLEGQVYTQLLDKIRFGTFALGQKLPSEHELCEEYSVSRPVVRAALAKLRDGGLIVSRQGAGSFVNNGNPANLHGYTPLKSIEDIAGYFRFRKMIEMLAVERAAMNTEHVRKDGARRLTEIVHEASGLLARGEAAIGLDIKFHTTICELSDNRFLVETMEMLRPHWFFVGNFVRSLGVSGNRTGKRMTGEHNRIIEAIAAGDVTAAKLSMDIHINESESRVFKG